MTVEAVKEFGLSRKDAARAKNMFALGLLSWMYGRPDRDHHLLPGEAVRQGAGHPRRQRHGVQGGLELRRDHRGVRGPVRDQAGADVGRASTATSPATSPSPTGWWPARVQSGLPIFLGTYPITPASDVLHELSKHKRFGITTFQAEDEIAGIGAALGASFVGSLGVTSTSGPGHRAEVGDHRPRGDDRAAAGRHRRAARRPLHRAAHQDRAGRPAAGDVRPQRRVAGADRRAAVAGRLLRRRRRGHPDRGHLPHPGDAALRRHARQRLRAVADPRHRRPARRSTRRSRPAPNHEGLDKAGNATEDFWPYLRDEETLARPWAIPGTAGLEHRIGGLEKGDGHGNISYDPGNHDYMVRIRQAKVDRIADSLPPLEVDDPVSGTGQGPGARLGLDVRPDRCGLPPRPQGGHRRRAGPPAPPQPVPQGPRRDPQAVRRGDDPRDEPRPALDADPREVPRRRRRLQPRARPAAEGGRARRGDHRPDQHHHRRGRPEGFHAGSAPPTKARRPSSDHHRAAPLPRARRRSRRPTRSRPARTSPPTRRCAGAPVAATTPCSRRCSRSCPTSACCRENIVFVSGHRLLVAVPVLPRDLRHALHPRPRPGDRHRHRHRPRGPVGVGGHR